MIINLYKINPDNSYGGMEESYSEVVIDIARYAPPKGFTFSSPYRETDIWNGEAWVEPPIPYVPTLDKLKEAKCVQIRAESDARISMLEQGYTMGEVKTFEQQCSGAKAIVASNPVHEHALFVQDLLTVRIGRTPTTEELMTFANRIILNYDTAKAYTVNIIGTQQYLENRVRACTTAEEVEAVPVWLG